MAEGTHPCCRLILPLAVLRGTNSGFVVEGILQLEIFSESASVARGTLVVLS
jgi:hypothetical protein